MAGGMECLIGIKFDSFVILAHDNSAGRSVLMMKQDQDKLIRLGDSLGMVVCGEAGDTVYFTEYIQKNVTLYRMRNGYAMSPRRRLTLRGWSWLTVSGAGTRSWLTCCWEDVTHETARPTSSSWTTWGQWRRCRMLLMATAPTSLWAPWTSTTGQT